MTGADHTAATKVALWLDRVRMDDRTPAMLDVTDDAIRELVAFRERLVSQHGSIR